MKNIIFDTDIGGDCDDVMALDVLLAAHKAKECKLLGTVYSWKCADAPYGMHAISAYYGCGNIPVGSRAPVPDYKDCYSRPVKNAFPTEAKCEVHDAVRLMRRLLTENEDVTIVATGSFYNIAKLLQSEPDDISPLDGRALVKARVREFAIMAANFSHQNGLKPQAWCVDEENRIRPERECNICLDLEETKYFFENCPVDVVLSPFEMGFKLITGAPMVKSGKGIAPDSLAYVTHGSPEGRDSWDPITAYYAVYGAKPYMYLTAPGTVRIIGENTDFIPGEGNTRILYAAVPDEELARVIDESMLRLKG